MRYCRYSCTRLRFGDAEANVSKARHDDLSELFEQQTASYSWGRSKFIHGYEVIGKGLSTWLV